MSFPKIRAALAGTALVVSVMAVGSPASATDDTPTAVVGEAGATGTTLTGVNDSGMAIGYSNDPDNGHGIVWTAADGVTEIKTPNGDPNTTPQAVNASGQVIGSWTDDTDYARGLVWTKADGTKALGFDEPNTDSSPVAENDAGQIIVQNYRPSDSSYSAYVGTPGDWSAVTAPDGSTTGVLVMAINADGDVAGIKHIQGQVDHAFLWSSTNGAVDLGVFPGTKNMEIGIDSLNDDDAMVGTASLADGSNQAFRWTPQGGLKALDTPEGRPSRGLWINASGLAAGDSELSDGSASAAYAWTPAGTLEDMGDLGEPYADPEALADDGRAVGSVGGGSDSFAFVWSHDSGMVELAPLNSSGDRLDDAQAISPNGRFAVGVSAPDKVGDSYPPNVGAVWDLDAALSNTTTASAPRAVQAAAGDGSATVWWQAPAVQGGARVSSYTVTASPGGATSTVSVDSGGADASTTVSGLTNGTAYTFTVKATNSVGTGDSSNPTSPAVTPRAGAPAPQETSGEVGESDGGTVSTGDHSTAAQPVTTTVTVPGDTDGGQVKIVQGAANQTAPSGYSFAGQQVDISAPGATFDNPLRLVFTIGSSQTGGADASSLQLFRTENGGSPTLLPDCTSNDGTATPDPCISSRQTGPDGEIDLTVLTSSASIWNFATKAQTPPPPHFSFKGFYSPVSNPPKINKVKAGSTVPMPFSLNGYHGTAVIASGYPKSTAVSCSHPTQTYGAVTTTTGALTYSSKTKRYTYGWHTSKTSANTCRAVEIRLSDGTHHYALFHLTK